MTKFNPCLCSPSPRDIPEVLEAHTKLKCDKLYAKYFIEREAYWHLRNFFLHADQEYTHMILAPDDLVITPEDYNQLVEDIKKYNYPIISGICNVDQQDYKDYWDITENLPHPLRPLKDYDDYTGKERSRWWGYRWYSWFDDNTIKDEVNRQKGNPIIRVLHSGFALQALRRDVVERINFITDAEVNGIVNAECSSVDVMFSNTCAVDGIAIMADTRIKMRHLRNSGPVQISLGDSYMQHIVDGKENIYKVGIPTPKEFRMFDQQK